MNQIVRDEIAPKVEEAIRDSGILDDYVYEVALQVLPTPQGPQPVIGLVLAVPNPAEVGTRLSAMTFIPGPIPPDIAISTSVLGLINSLGEQRNEALGQAPADGPPDNVRQLILPS